MKLTSVQIKNFQSHQDTKFELSPGINAFIGESNQGKSATLRSLLWAIENRPGGDAIVSDWARDEKGNLTDACAVTATSDEGKSLRRIKEASRNGYDVGGAKLNAIRTSVPQEVSDFFNLGDVNIQRQLDQPYMLAVSPGERARVFNGLIKLEDIDRCLSSIEKLRRATTSKRDTLKEDQAREEAQLKGLAWVEDAETKMQELEALDAERLDLQTRAARLRALLEGVSQKAALLPRYARVEEFEARALAVRRLLDAARQVSQQYNGLSEVVRGLRASEQLAGEIPQLDRALAQITQLRALFAEKADLRNRTTALQGLLTALQTQHVRASLPGPQGLDNRIAVLGKLESSVKKIREQARGLKALLDASTLAWRSWETASNTLRELESQLPDTCPYCGGVIEEKHDHG